MESTTLSTIGTGSHESSITISNVIDYYQGGFLSDVYLKHALENVRHSCEAHGELAIFLNAPTRHLLESLPDFGRVACYPKDSQADQLLALVRHGLELMDIDTTLKIDVGGLTETLVDGNEDVLSMLMCFENSASEYLLGSDRKISLSDQFSIYRPFDGCDNGLAIIKSNDVYEGLQNPERAGLSQSESAKVAIHVSIERQTGKPDPSLDYLRHQISSVNKILAFVMAGGLE